MEEYKGPYGMFMPVGTFEEVAATNKEAYKTVKETILLLCKVIMMLIVAIGLGVAAGFLYYWLF